MELIKLPKTKKLTTKDISVLSMVSLRSADRIKKQIKDTYNVKIVRYRHYLRYYEEI